MGEDVARIARDKYVMRKTLEAEGIPQPMYGLARTVDEAIEQADRIGFPVVVKPVVNNDTSYIRRVADIDELRRCFPSLQYGAWHVKGNASLYNWARHDYGNAVIIEEFLPGLDVSVESIVTDGQTHVVAIHDKPNPEEGPYLVDVRYTTPSKLPMDTQLCIHHL
ncbi:ATP-grasp domain-containing protein, partial [Kitasatospora cystarginea]|uniref:ATP-grasp domain-containing protein n=1 Tax=Kitasatospora cystarginea TaxID=58350 RepID=UPI0031D42422